MRMKIMQMRAKKTVCCVTGTIVSSWKNHLINVCSLVVLRKSLLDGCLKATDEEVLCESCMTYVKNICIRVQSRRSPFYSIYLMRRI